jgi:hypothetical protein
MALYKQFGELDSAEEINELANTLRSQKDTESINVLAKENGLDLDVVEAFIDGDIFFITDRMYAAFGKLDVELEEVKTDPIGESVVELLKTKAVHDEEMLIGIRKKGKSLKKVLSLIWKEAGSRKSNCAGGASSVLISTEVYSITKKYYLGSR